MLKNDLTSIPVKSGEYNDTAPDNFRTSRFLR
jgi:hypothetical protein